MERAEAALVAVREEARTRLGEHPRSVIDANLIRARVASGRLGDDATVIEAALDAFERLGDDPWVAEAGALATRVHVAAGAHGAALAALRRALAAGLRHVPAPHLAHPVAVVADLLARCSPLDATRLHALVAASPRTPGPLRRASLTALGRGASPSRTPEVALRPAAAAPIEADDALRRAARRLLDGTLPSGADLALAIRSCCAR